MKADNRPNVGKAGCIMMASLLLSRVLGLVRDMVMAWMFGKGANTDAYVLSFQIPDILFYLIAGGALSSAFIPVFSDYLHTEREDDAWKVFSSVVTIMSTVIIGVILILWIFATPLSYVIAPGSDSIRPLIVHMSRILLPAQYAFFIGGIMFGTLYARQVFSVPGLGPNIYNLGILFGAIVLSHFVSPGIVGMTWGALIGAVLGNIVVPAIAMRRLKSRFQVSYDTKHEGVRKVFKLMLPVILGLSLPQVYSMILQDLGTLYRTDGVNTALNYGNRLMQVPLGVFGQSLAIAAFPALSQFFAQKRMDMFGEQLVKTMRTVVFLTVPVSAMFVVMPTEIIRAAFQHGAWTAADTAVTAPVFQMFALGIAAWSVQPVLMRGFFSAQNTITPIVLGTVTTLLFGVVAFIIVQTKTPYIYLPLAGSISATLLVVMMLFSIRKIVPDLKLGGFLTTLSKSLGASAIAAGLLYACLPLLSQVSEGMSKGIAKGFSFLGHGPSQIIGRVSGLLPILLIALLFAWVYFALAVVFKMPESDYLKRAMKRIDKKKKGTDDETVAELVEDLDLEDPDA